MNGDNEKAADVERLPLQSRRGFIKYFLFGSAFTWLLSAFYGFFRFFTPPKVKEKPLLKSVDLPKDADSFEKNSSMIFRFGDKPAILIREKTGQFKAYFATCTHLGCLVQYNPKTGMIICPCHDGIFDLNGKNVAGPPTEPLDHLDVHFSRTNKIRIFLPGSNKE